MWWCRIIGICGSAANMQPHKLQTWWECLSQTVISFRSHMSSARGLSGWKTKLSGGSVMYVCCFYELIAVWGIVWVLVSKWRYVVDVLQRESSVLLLCSLTGVVLKSFSHIQTLMSMTWNWLTMEVTCIFLEHHFARYGTFTCLLVTLLLCANVSVVSNVCSVGC